MVEKQIFLSPAGAVKTAGYEQPLRLGYAKNWGVYRLTVTASSEWAGLTIRAFWHVPGGTDPPASLVTDGMVEVPALVTALPGCGCITFEGTDGNRTLTSGDLAYCVSANSGTEDGTMPEPGTPAWQAFLNAHSSGLSGTEKQVLLALLAPLSEGNADATAAYEALEELWTAAQPDETAILGKALLGRARLEGRTI
jgi:hypothetical protein